MKKYFVILFFAFAAPHVSDAQVLIIKWITTKIIKAIDLKVQQLQNQTIALQLAQKAAENNLSKTKLYEIGDLVSKQKELYKDYFDELNKVKSVIAYYRRISELINQQKQFVARYQRGLALVRQDGHFSLAEIETISGMYESIIHESIRNLEQVALVVNSFSLKVTDADRLEMINECADKMERQLGELQKLNQYNAQVSLQRSRDAKDVLAVRQLYGL